MAFEIRCAHCDGFIGLTESTQPLPSIYHAPCLRREQAAVPATPVDEGALNDELDLVEAVEAEREACAKIVEDSPLEFGGLNRRDVASRIRARST
jgi:hypothetical protein